MILLLLLWTSWWSLDTKHQSLITDSHLRVKHCRNIQVHTCCTVILLHVCAQGESHSGFVLPYLTEQTYLESPTISLHTLSVLKITLNGCDIEDSYWAFYCCPNFWFYYTNTIYICSILWCLLFIYCLYHRMQTKFPLGVSATLKKQALFTHSRLRGRLLLYLQLNSGRAKMNHKSEISIHPPP